MQAALREEFGVEARLIEGHDGVFDVILDGETIFCKFEEMRFPRKEEIMEAIKKLRQ